MTKLWRSVSMILLCVFGIIILLAIAFDHIPQVLMPLRRGTAEMIVVIDIGHGGRDPGAVIKSTVGSNSAPARVICEHDIVYDIGVRLLLALREKEGIEAISTLVIPRNPTVQDSRLPKAPRSCALSTDPPCDLNRVDTQTAVNLRWMLANAIVRRIEERKRGEPVIAFVSIHADARSSGSGPGVSIIIPPRLRGVPLIADTRTYANYREGRIHIASGLSSSKLEQNEGSHLLAAAMARSFYEHGIQIYGNSMGIVAGEYGTPIPAVLNYNLIPHRILLEVGNLRNRVDIANLCDPQYRQKIADAIAKAIVDFADLILSQRLENH